MFKLSQEPCDYQLTVHFQNFKQSSMSFVDCYNYVKAYINSDFVCKEQAAMYNMIQHYGSAKIESFITEVLQLPLAS